MNRTFSLLLAATLTLSSYQGFSNKMTPGAEDKEPLKTSLALDLGLTGPGLDFGLGLNQRFGFRLKATYFQYKDYPYQFYVSTAKMETKTSVQLGIADLLVDFHPFKNGIFRITAGPTFFIKNKVQFRGYLTEPVYFNEVEFTPDEIGYINADIEWKKVGAYLGVGIGRTVPTKRFGFGCDLGVYYMGKPSLDLTATEKIAPTEDQETVIEQNMEVYQFLPYLNFRMSYRLTK